MWHVLTHQEIRYGAHLFLNTRWCQRKARVLPGALDGYAGANGVGGRDALASAIAGTADAAVQVDVNLTAPIDLSLQLLPLLLAQPSAAIVNVVSLPGTRHTDRALVHAAARAGLDAFSAALARRLVETKIQVHTVRRAPAEGDPADRPRHNSKATAAAILAAVDARELDIEVR